jgi:hypothetical protein
MECAYLFVSGLEHHPLFEISPIVIPETREITVFPHHLDILDDVMSMPLHGSEPQKQELFEIVEHIGVEASHQVDVLLREFEGGLLEVHVAGGDPEQEAEVDVQDVAVGVDQDVAVVPVFDEEQVADQRVPGQAVCEVFAGDVPLVSEDLPVDLDQVAAPEFLQRAHCHGVGQVLDEALIPVEHYDGVRFNPQWNVELVDDVFGEFY